MQLNKTLLIYACLSMAFLSCKKEPMIQLTIDTHSELHTLAGGMGASWHAISKEIPLDNHKYDYPVREVNPRGSAYGGNPPVTDTAAWQQIFDHAEWLGLNWFRVELSQRMYEAQRRAYDWENEEMQALYLILDWCEEHQADVFLQQMWGYVEWNAHDGVHPLLSAPKSLDDFAHSIAALLSHLTEEKGFTCIKYFSLVNEPPGGTWGYWWSYGSGSGSVTSAWKRVYAELQKQDIQIPLSGPDWTDLPPFEAGKIDFDAYIGAYDIHTYHGVGSTGEKILGNWARWAHDRGKPFFLTEFGNMNLGWGTDDPGPKSFDAALSNAEDILRGLRQGVDAFNRWSFTNRGNLDGQWQLIKTYDPENGQYLKTIHPEKEAYYGYGILTRFLAKHATVLESNLSGLPNSFSLFTSALRNPDGSLVVYIVNRDSLDQQIEIKIKGQSSENLFLYQVKAESINQKTDPIQAQEVKQSNGTYRVSVPRNSISTFTDIFLWPNDKGVIAR